MAPGTRGASPNFSWTHFYEAIATKLLDYQDDRKVLMKGIHRMSSKIKALSGFKDQFGDDTSGPLEDICPFTVMATFNQRMRPDNRKAIATELANFLDVRVKPPKDYDGIPNLLSNKSWFFGYAKDREEADIDILWKVFSKATTYVESDLVENRNDFATAYDAAIRVKQVARNLSFGLFWIRPWNYPSLDYYSCEYMEKRLGLTIAKRGPKKIGTSEDYLNLIDSLKNSFQKNNCPVNSFPQLVLESDTYRRETEKTKSRPETVEEDEGSFNWTDEYTSSHIVNDGCFLPEDRIKRLLERLRTKKNLILQGPPGTGKTWLAKRLAFALMGRRDQSRVRTVQFHPNLSYEDFVKGWRPSGEGRLELVNGAFMEAVESASSDPESPHVIVIEEINRGNPAQIFGELLTLLEAGKRNPDDALELSYSKADEERQAVHIPENLHVIGTMNLADRSLAMVDFALRRRFAFATLEPMLGDVWREWVVNKRAVNRKLAADIDRRINELNDTITKDPSLGTQYCVGHSYVTPAEPLAPDETRDWFIEVVETEIAPLLEEYWFDSPKTAQDATKALLSGW